MSTPVDNSVGPVYNSVTNNNTNAEELVAFEGALQSMQQAGNQNITTNTDSTAATSATNSAVQDATSAVDNYSYNSTSALANQMLEEATSAALSDVAGLDLNFPSTSVSGTGSSTNSPISVLSQVAGSGSDDNSSTAPTSSIGSKARRMGKVMDGGSNSQEEYVQWLIQQQQIQQDQLSSDTTKQGILSDQIKKAG